MLFRTIRSWNEITSLMMRPDYVFSAINLGEKAIKNGRNCLESTIFFTCNVYVSNLMRNKCRAVNLLLRKAGFTWKTGSIMVPKNAIFKSCFNWLKYSICPEVLFPLLSRGLARLLWHWIWLPCKLHSKIGQFWSDSNTFIITFLVNKWAEPIPLQSFSLGSIEKLDLSW